MALKKKAVKQKKKTVLPKRKILKKPLKKAAKKKPALKPVVAKKTKEAILGKITHYFPKVRAAVLKLKAPLLAGDTIRIKGHTTDFKQNVISMQIDRNPITKAKKGDEIGLLVDSRVRKKDTVYKV